VVLHDGDGIDHALGEQALVQHIQVAHVCGPELVVPVGGEGHLLLGRAAACYHLVAVDLANPGEDPAAGGAAQTEALLL
jgi:hypothetical protein